MLADAVAVLLAEVEFLGVVADVVALLLLIALVLFLEAEVVALLLLIELADWELLLVALELVLAVLVAAPPDVQEALEAPGDTPAVVVALLFSEATCV